MESIMTRKEFEALAEQNNWEVYTQRQVYQFSQDILKSVDEQERFNGAVDYASLSRVEVLNEDLTKSVMFYREQQVEWDRTEGGTLMKARSGVYKDTPANRKKGIVGQRYGMRPELAEFIKENKQKREAYHKDQAQKGREYNEAKKEAAKTAKKASDLSVGDKIQWNDNAGSAKGVVTKKDDKFVYVKWKHNDGSETETKERIKSSRMFYPVGTHVEDKRDVKSRWDY